MRGKGKKNDISDQISVISKQENTYAECAEDLDFGKKRDDNTAFTEITEVGESEEKTKREMGDTGEWNGGHRKQRSDVRR